MCWIRSIIEGVFLPLRCARRPLIQRSFGFGQYPALVGHSICMRWIGSFEAHGGSHSEEVYIGMSMVWRDSYGWADAVHLLSMA